MGKKVIIIGAGMAGLSAGIHLQNNGYDTLILEAHSIPGGLVTAWKRKNYIFDGCVHWIPGCNEQDNLYCVNHEVFDMSKLELVRHETIFDIECLHSSAPDGDRFFHMYSGIDRLEEYMKWISPRDSQIIEEYTGLVRSLAGHSLPPTLKPAQLMSMLDKIGMLKHLPLLLNIKRASGYSVKEFAARFSNPFLKEAFEKMSFGREYPILVLMIRNVFGQQHSAAYPKGGSARLAGLAEERYKAYGGEIRYNSRVKTILTEEGRATGVVLENGEEIKADIVISAADGHWTLFEALQGKYLTPDLKELYEGKKLEVFESNVFVSLGVKRSFDDLPNEQFLAFEKPRKLCDGSIHHGIQAHIINYDSGFAPEGCTVINTMLTTWEDSFWTKLRSEDRAGYERMKEQARDFVVDALEEKIGGIRENTEAWDAATPATFIRYTNNWHGSIQGWLPSNQFLAAKPLRRELPGLKDFYMIGQWTEPGGGITPAVKTGRDAAWIICARDRKKFVTAPFSYRAEIG